jgi:hypothetical protein
MIRHLLAFFEGFQGLFALVCANGDVRAGERAVQSQPVQVVPDDRDDLLFRSLHHLFRQLSVLPGKSVTASAARRNSNLQKISGTPFRALSSVFARR